MTEGKKGDKGSETGWKYRDVNRLPGRKIVSDLTFEVLPFRETSV